MNREEMKQIIPHREPMLLVDEAYVDENGTAHGQYRVRGDEWFLKGHYPGNPVVPGVILCEMMAQSGCVMIADIINGKVPYFTGLDKIRFKNKVVPGDLLEITCVITRKRPPAFFAKGTGTVNGKVCVSGEFSFFLV